jgi:hypothetical protein
MKMLHIVPVYKCGEPVSGLMDVLETPRVLCAVFQSFEKRFDERIVIAYPRPAVRV